MNRLNQSLALAAVALMANSGVTLAQEISDAADLTAVIALNGKPCGKVVSAAKRGEDDDEPTGLVTRFDDAG